MKNRGMTLIEVLTVIAIIAILAAIIFPVAGTVRERARRANCISNINQLQTALKMYKLNMGGFPPALLGYVGYKNPPTNTIPYPADELRTGFLFGGDIKSVNVFKCPNNYIARNTTETANVVWPNITWAPSTGKSGAVNSLGGQNVSRIGPSGTQNAVFYKWDSYDASFNPNTNTYELRYTLKWSDAFLTNGDRTSDDRRQLGYKEPDESTIVTWCTYHRNLDGAKLPKKSVDDIVLMLDGSVKTVDSTTMYQHGWSYNPTK